MFTEDKITEIFCIADDFCNFFDAQMKKYTFKSDKKRQYHIIFIKKVLLGKCTGISFVDSTPLRVCRNQRNRR